MRLNASGERLRERNWILAATYAFGIHTLHAGYGRTQEGGNHKVSLGYVHPLSKRTKLYADIYREKAVDHKTGFAAGTNHTL